MLGQLAFEDLRGNVAANQSLADYTSWRVGGPADLLYLPADAEDLTCFLAQLPLELPLYWMGLGSNTLVRDGGVEGAVIVTQGRLNGLEQEDSLLVRAEAGVACAQLARFCARLNLEGAEFMAGIPGTVGGALAMNAGCFGGETWDIVTQVETIDRRGQRRLRPSSDFAVGYRHVQRPADEWFLAGHFKLNPGDKTTSLEKIRNLLERRSNTQPTNHPTCGSVFRNPPENYAGQLIEGCGLKGKKKGGASVSTKHANFIINEGQAKAADIEALVEEIQAIVENERQIRLIPEVCIVGRPVR